MDSLTVCGIRSPNLCVFCQYFLAVLDMILSLFLITFFIQHTNSCSSTICLSTAYSSSCTRKYSLISLTWFQVELPYFHFMKTSHPLVVYSLLLFPLDIWIKESPSLICVISVRKSMMALNNTKSCPCWSTWENKFLYIALAVISILYPSAYSNSYILVSSIGLSAAITIGLPYLSFHLLLTLENSGPSSCLSNATSYLRNF